MRSANVHVICNEVAYFHPLISLAAARITRPDFTGVEFIAAGALLTRAPVRRLVQQGADFDCVRRREQVRLLSEDFYGRDPPHIVHADARRA